MTAIALLNHGVIGSGGEIFTLSGIDGTPILAFDSSIDPADARIIWEFQTDGEAWMLLLAGSDSQYRDGIEFSSKQPSPIADLWIKATQSGVTSPGSSPNAGSSSLDSWLKVVGGSATNRSWGWSKTTIGTLEGTIKVNLSTDVSGSPIVATGYYKGTALVDV